ncbi:hypothetical protein AB1284_25935 [Bacillus sp. S2(2024)]|uniref:hypothetical protein n=1 Tax=Bacillus sp. S2(2024) TaxID=3162887 RepID=UPI003D1DDC20
MLQNNKYDGGDVYENTIKSMLNIPFAVTVVYETLWAGLVSVVAGSEHMNVEALVH